MGALQTSAFIALGRLFDQQSAHNLDRVLRIAQDHPQIFSKAALARRKQGSKTERPEWLDQYLRTAYEPTSKDLRRLRGYVRKWRRVYETNYRDVRHQFFAHKQAAEHAEVAGLFSKGTNRELQQLFVFLGQLHQALWQMFFNGTKPVLRPARYSVTRIRKQPAPPSVAGLGVQELIVRETEQFLVSLAKNLSAKPSRAI